MKHRKIDASRGAGRGCIRDNSNRNFVLLDFSIISKIQYFQIAVIINNILKGSSMF